MKKSVYILLIGLLLCGGVGAQDSTKVSFLTGFDLVNRYVWRGAQFSDSPNLQPYMSVGFGGFSLMGWGSYAMGKNYAEIDLFLSYNLKGVTLSVNDYFNEQDTALWTTNWREWDRAYTGHLVEAQLSYTTSGENHPLTLTASTLIYGADLDDAGEQRYSTYFEASYPFSVKDYELSITAGGTVTSDGFYSSHAGLVNVGVQAVRDIKVNDNFSIPLSLSLVYNPENDDSFMVLMLSF